MIVIYSVGFLLDLLLGDPQWMLHPVRLLGLIISKVELLLRKTAAALIGLKGAGFLLTALVVGLTYFVTWGLIALGGRIHPLIGTGVAIWLLFTTVAYKGLGEAALNVYRPLKRANLTLAQQQLGLIVGRDTANLSEAEVVRGAVETVAENLVDGITSPLFYAIIGGVPLAMAYRAINTLDSMVGYKNENYREFGFASAKLDDVANYLPARLTIPFLLLAQWLLGWDVKTAWLAMRLDAHKHPSPNSGICEALVAGGLGVQLGGINYYQGVPSRRALMGWARRELVAEDIKRCVRVICLAAIFFWITGLLVLVL